MARALATAIALLGLVGAAFLLIDRGTSAVPGLVNQASCDRTLFAIAISVLSIMLLVTFRSQPEPDPNAGDSLTM